MSVIYSLEVKNKTNIGGMMCVYQSNPNPEIYRNLLPLAWLAVGCQGGVTVNFDWDIDYQFVWSRTGPLKPGARFKTSEKIETDPFSQDRNSIGLTFDEKHGYKFVESKTPSTKGSLLITCDNTMENDDAAIGVAMSGKGVFAQNARPNMSFSFTPKPKYYLAFGDFQEGEVMDMNRVTTDSFRIDFGPNCHSLSVTLNEDNTWSKGVSLYDQNKLIPSKK